MKFKIIQKRKNFLGLISNAQYAALSFFVLAFLSMKVTPRGYFELFGLGLFLGLFSVIVYSMFDYQKLNADIVGDLIFEKDHIIINKELIPYNEIQKMELFTNYYRGEDRIPTSSNFFSPWNYIGKNNFIKIKCFDQRVFNLEFQILSLHDLKKLNEFYAHLLLTEKISLYSHSLHKVPKAIKQTPSFLLYVYKLVDNKTIGKQYSERVLSDRY